MKTTGVILVITMCILGIYDLFAFLYGGEVSTISRFIKSSGYDHPAVILVIGYLLGHWFSPMKCSKCLERELNGRV